MNENDVANILTPQLLNRNFIVHRYNSHTTSSIYLKLDYGLSCGIRIADHKGKSKYHYRFNVIKDFNGNKVNYENNLISYFFNYNELEKVIKGVEKEKEQKLKKYGIDKYNSSMKQQSQNDLYNRFEEVKGVT